MPTPNTEPPRRSEDPLRAHAPARLSRGDTAFGLATAALLVVAFWPTLLWLGRSWSVDPYYTHGPVALAAAAFFVWRARADLTSGNPSALGAVLVAGGLAARMFTVARPDHVVEAFGLLLVLAGLAAIVGGRAGLRAAALPLAILALAVPLPHVALLAPWLAAHAAGHAAGAAGLIGFEVVRSGAQLIVADGAMTVGAPCSGLRSLVALVTLALVIAGVLQGPVERRALIVAAAIPIALLANGARLVGLISIASALGVDRGLGFFHGPSSGALFLASAAGLVVIGRALGCDVPLEADADERR